MKFFLIALIVIITQLKCIAQIQGIGLWRDHLSYQNALQIVQGDKIYAATSNGLIIIDPQKNTLETFSKADGLNDIGIAYMAYDSSTSQIVIGYTNSNIDVYKNGIVKNIGDILRSTILGDKTINHIFCKNGFAYVSTGLGVIVINLSKYEVKDTYIIGSGGSKIKINATAINNNFILAATTEGLKIASLNSNLASVSNWINLSGNNGLSNGEVKGVCNLGSINIVQKNDSLFSYNGINFSFIYTDIDWPIINTNCSSNKILVCNRKANGQSKVVQLNATGVIEKTVAVPNVISFPKQATLINNEIWVADFFGGVSKNATNQFMPNGPPGTADGQLVFANNSIIAAAGSVNDNYNYLFNRNGIYFFEQERWSSVSSFNNKVLDTLLDFTNLAYDNINNILYAGSYGGGLLSVDANNSLKIYKQNSTINATVGDPSSYRVAGLGFDNNNNLWIANYGAAKPLSCKKANGSFVNFSVPYTLIENSVSQIVADNNNNLFIVSPKGNGLLCYNYGNNIDITNDDKWKYFRQGKSNGNLPSNNVNCIAKDKNGLIWVGTKNGVAIIGCFDEVFNVSCEAVLPIVKQDAFAGFLFANEDVQCIAVDAANRKWVGTKNGVWLISEDGEKIINSFNQTNSSLLHNNVRSIVIHPITGEVFFATTNGICSYRGTATEVNENATSAFVFPNPIPSNFKGQIGIKNVPANSIVKITELNGRLVYQTKANGTQAVWNGLNYNNQKVVGGIYLVFAKTQDGLEKLVTKIVKID
jgi:hypothetical protein